MSQGSLNPNGVYSILDQNEKKGKKIPSKKNRDKAQNLKKDHYSPKDLKPRKEGTSKNCGSA